MKKRKILLGLAIASAAVFGLSACNGSAPEPTPSQQVEQVGVTFKDGEKVLQAVQVDKNGKVNKPFTVSQKEDADNFYVFDGWFTTATNQVTPFDFDTPISEATTLYAKWHVVSKATSIMMNGTAYETIAAALAAVPATSTDTFTIYLPKGTYNENGLEYDGSATIKLVGNTATEYGADVIIKGHGSNMSQEKTRNLISIRGTGDIILENLTLESDWTRTLAGGNNAQAEVLGTDTKGKTVAYNCSFKSHQDTLRTAGKAWFYGCYIEGDVDFIWMEQAGSVALYEECEIVSVYDATASSHASYFAAPRMAKTMKVGKGLVIYNSTLYESDEAKANNQQTYMARNPWSNETTYYNQVAYINADVKDVESKIWYNNQTATEFDKTVIGYKMDKATADKLGYTGNDDVLTDADKAKEYGGREAILNRVFNTGKLKFEKDNAGYWDINALILANKYTVAKDTSSATAEGEAVGESTSYIFDGATDVSSLVEGFKQDGTKKHFVGQAGNTITIPVTGKCYVEVYGYYAGTVETKGNTDEQGTHVMFFNNGSTSAEIENDYIVYDDTTTSVTITAKATTYITKIVVTKDASITKTAVDSITVTANTSTYCVGIPLKLSAKANPGAATNKSVVWSSSDETVATIEKYTGKVTFLAAGEATFTATACDGSGKTGTFTCTAKDPKWTVAEWYTTDTTVETEEGAADIDAFDTAGSAYKSLDNTYTFTNIAGESISTNKGLKQNSSGQLIVYTTKGNAQLTVITDTTKNEKATPIVSDGEKSITPVSTTQNADKTATFVYNLPSAGAWKITRGDTTKECNPIVYARCEYMSVISADTELTFGDNGNYENPSLFTITATIKNNGGNNAQVKNGNIEFTVAAGAQVEVYANWGEAYKINLADGTIEAHDGTNVGNEGKRIYTYATQTKVTIQCDPDATGHNYFYWIKVTFPTA